MRAGSNTDPTDGHPHRSEVAVFRINAVVAGVRGLVDRFEALLVRRSACPYHALQFRWSVG